MKFLKTTAFKSQKENLMELNNDKLNGTINASVGKVKENAGKVTGDQNMEAEGAAQKTKGQVQKLSGSVKDTIKKAQTLMGIKSKRF